MLLVIREEFRQICRSSKDSISTAELTQHWIKHTEDEQQKIGNGLLSLQDKQVIKLRVSQLMQEMDIKKTGRISMEEWVHYMLLAQTKRSANQINSLLHTAMDQQPQILKDLQLMFEAADKEGHGTLTFNAIMEMYSRKLWHLRPGNDGRPLSGTELDAGDPDQFARDIIKEMDLNGDEKISYAEFMAYCVGRRKQEVTLHLYDLSNGMGQKLAPWILDHSLDGVWHTGLVCFGKEYFFSRDTVFDEAGATSFGKPCKVVSLGYTLWRQSELHKYIVDELKPKFHRDTYDAIDFNCNNFTNELCQYLCGKDLPPEVYNMALHLKSSALIRTIRPVLTWWLRDGVVARGKEVSVESDAEGRVKVDKPLRAGTVVKIFPADCAEGSPILGLVTQLEGQSIGPAGDSILQGSKTPRWDLCGCSYVAPANQLQDKAWVQFFDLNFDIELGVCRGELRTEIIPHSRLSVEKMEGGETTC